MLLGAVRNFEVSPLDLLPIMAMRVQRFQPNVIFEEELGADAKYAGEEMYRHIAWD